MTLDSASTHSSCLNTLHTYRTVTFSCTCYIKTNTSPTQFQLYTSLRHIAFTNTIFVYFVFCLVFFLYVWPAFCHAIIKRILMMMMMPLMRVYVLHPHTNFEILGLIRSEDMAHFASALVGLRPWPWHIGLRVASKVGNLPSKFGHAGRACGFSNYSLRTQRTDRRTDKSNAYSPFSTGRGIINVGLCRLY